MLQRPVESAQYASKDYRQALSDEGFVVSMSRRGDCYDNAPVESFFATLKKELVAGEVFYTREHARREIVEYIEGFYTIAGGVILPLGISVQRRSRSKSHELGGAPGFP